MLRSVILTLFLLILSSFALLEFILLTEAMLIILKGKSNNVIFLLLTPNCLPITFKVQTP